jgi:hypothetical protein
MEYVKILTAIVILSVISCFKKRGPYPENCVPIKISFEKYVVFSVDPPKHFSVSLISAASGKKFYDIGGSKHCDDWPYGPKVGEIVLIKTTTYRDTIKKFNWSVPSEDDIQRIWCNS